MVEISRKRYLMLCNRTTGTSLDKIYIGKCKKNHKANSHYISGNTDRFFLSLHLPLWEKIYKKTAATDVQAMAICITFRNKTA